MGIEVHALHLYVVLCGPTLTTNSVIIVSFNTVTAFTDPTLILNDNDHDFIEHPTAVSYDRTIIKAVPELEVKEAANANWHPNFRTFRRHEPASPELLTRLLAGAIASPLISKAVKAEIRRRTELQRD